MLKLKKRPKKTTQKSPKRQDKTKEEQKKEEEEKKFEEKPNLIPSLQPFIKYIHWDHADPGFFLKEFRNNKMMTEDEENVTMAKMLRSLLFVQRKSPSFLHR